VNALQRRVAELEQDLTATEYALSQSLTQNQNTPSKNLPAVRTSTSTGQSVTVWRRGRS
jgi:hypothetical protein